MLVEEGAPVTSESPFWNSPFDCPAALANFGKRSAPNSRKKIAIRIMISKVPNLMLFPLVRPKRFRFVNQSAVNRLKQAEVVQLHLLQTVAHHHLPSGHSY